MDTRVPPSVRTSQRIAELLKSGTPQGDVASEFIRLSVRKVYEEALEAEARDAVGRDFYEHGAAEGEGYRNGYRTGKLKTAEGIVEYSAPQVSDRAEPFVSRVRQHMGDRSDELLRLANEMYARGLSTRDIEGAFQDSAGRLLLSRTAVSEVTERLWKEYEAFANRDLSGFDLIYLFMDGLAERLHPSCGREAVLCSWGIDSDGKKHLIHLSPGTKEDTESVTAFIQDMKRRGLRDPLLVVTDGAPGLIAAVEKAFPRSVRQRCLAHKYRNLAKYVPEDRWGEFKAHAAACYQAPSMAVAKVLRDEVLERYKDLPAATRCFLDDFDACTAHLRFPLDHRKAIRTTNMLERLFGEERRRTKVMPHAFGEKPLMKVMYAAVIRASERWHGIEIKPFERQQWEAIRKELDDEFNQRHQPAVAPSKISSRFGT